MGLMDRLYRFGSKPYIMDYNGAVNFLGRCVVPIQIGDIIGSTVYATKERPVDYYFPVRITKPLNHKFNNVNIKLLTFGTYGFSISRVRVQDIKLYLYNGTEITTTKTVTRWYDTSMKFVTGSDGVYFEGFNAQIGASNISSYNNYYLLKVTVNNNISEVSQTKIFLEYDNYVSFLNTMENQRFNENQLEDFMFNDILANDMYQVGYFNSIYANWGGAGKVMVDMFFKDTDELVFKVPYVSQGKHWRLSVGLQEVGRTGEGEWFLVMKGNWWTGVNSRTQTVMAIKGFAMEDLIHQPGGGDPDGVESIMQFDNYYFSLYDGDTLIETITGVTPFYFNIFNKKTRVISAGDYADNLTLNRAIEAKWNVEKFTEMIDKTEEGKGVMMNYPMIKPPITWQPYYEYTWEGETYVTGCVPELDLNMACITELVNNIPIRSRAGQDCNSFNPQKGRGQIGTPFGSENTNLWEIPMGIMKPGYNSFGG